MADTRVATDVVATGQTGSVIGRSVDISLSGTWVGTVKLQRKMSGAFQDTGDSWTANVEATADGATPVEWRLDFTRTSGTLTVDIRAA